MQIIIFKQAEREMKDAPKEIKMDIFSLFDELSKGKKLSLPISRPLPSIGKGLHELRLSGKSGEYRVFYLIKIGDAIYVLHVLNKKTQSIDKKTVDLLKQRIRSLNL